MEQPPRQPAEETPDQPRRWEVDQVPVPLIYVASLSDYNAGVLHGTWIEAAQDPGQIEVGITAMLAASPTARRAEEWAIHDFDGFSGLHLGEHESLERVSLLARGIQTYGPAFGHWATLDPETAEADPRSFEERYEGHWPSLRDYGVDRLGDYGLEELLDQALPESLRPYVRIRPHFFAEELRMGGDITTAEAKEGGIYVFRSY